MTLRLATVVLLLGLFAPPMFGQSAAGRTASSWPTRILVTNDDGIDAPGLGELVRALSSIADVTVVAPAGNRSGSSSFASVLSGRVVVERRVIDRATAAYAVSGYPADCVLIGITGIMADDPPDLVVSGINTTANLADAWAYSGTLGAARIATLQGVPSIAVSGGTPDALPAVADWVTALIGTALVAGLEPPRYLAVDIPNRPLADLREVSVRPRARGVLRFRVRPGEPGAADIPAQDVWVAGGFSRNTDDIAGTDVEALEEGRIVVTAMRADEEDAAFLRELQERASELPDWPPAKERPVVR